jgi:hypothetical protein
MERARVCPRKEKTITTGRVEIASKWKWQRLEIVETTVHPLANGINSAFSTSNPPERWPPQPSSLPTHPSSLPPQLLNESVAVLTMKATAETNRGRCFNLTGTRRKYPVPIEGGVGHEHSPPACSCMQGRWKRCERRGNTMNDHLRLDLACEGGGGGHESPSNHLRLALACEGGGTGENGVESHECPPLAWSCMRGKWWRRTLLHAREEVVAPALDARILYHIMVVAQ